MKSQNTGAILSANEAYASQFNDKANLVMPPAKKFLILTCMDARLDPAKFAGLSEGDAHVVRNAGGRVTDDAIRSMIISHKLLGTQEWYVIHHTECGMEYFTNELMGEMLESSLASAAIGADGWVNPDGTDGSVEGRYIQWHTIQNREKAVVDDVKRLRNHPLVPADLPIYGYIYDVKTGKLIPVEEAMKAGE